MVGTADSAGASTTHQAGVVRTDDASETHRSDSLLPDAPAAVSSGGSASAADTASHPVDAWDEWQEVPPPVVPLTREQAQQLFGQDVARPSRVTPLRVVAAQIGLTCLAMVVSGVFCANHMAGVYSALIGGAICWVPSAAFALYLARRGRDSVGVWMMAEGVKLGLTIAMFIAVALLYKEARWLPLLLTYVLALKTYWLALAWR